MSSSIFSEIFSTNNDINYLKYDLTSDTQMESLEKVIPFLRKFLKLKDVPFNTWFNCPESNKTSLANITIILRFEFDGTNVLLDELGTPLIEFITCKLNLKAKIVSYVENLNNYQGEYLANAWYLATSRVQNCHNIIFDDIFEFDIVTNRRLIGENTYFYTIRLFDQYTWMLIVISMITIATIWSKMSLKLNFHHAYWIMFEQLVSGSTQLFNQNKYLTLHSITLSKEYITIILVTIWIFASLVFSSCIRQTLLSFYLNKEFEPNINSLNELIERKGLNIEIVKWDSHKFKEFLGENFDLVNNRIVYIDWVGPQKQYDLAYRISEGKTVFICDSYLSKMVLTLAPFLRLSLAQNRYNQHFISASVTTGHPFSQQIMRGLSQMAFGGFQIRRSRVWDLFSKWFGRIITAFKNVTKNNFERYMEPIDLQDIGKEMGPILIIGLLLATIVLISEIIVKL